MRHAWADYSPVAPCDPPGRHGGERHAMDSLKLAAVCKLVVDLHPRALVREHAGSSGPVRACADTADGGVVEGGARGQRGAGVWQRVQVAHGLQGTGGEGGAAGPNAK